MGIVEKKEYSFSDNTGDAVITVYTVFPGIELVYDSVHTDYFDLSVRSEGSYIEIHHCHEGRIEQKFDEGAMYLMPGDLSIAVRSKTKSRYRFPLRHYHGITITIDVDVAPECFENFLDDVSVKPLMVAKRLCREKSFFVLRNETYIEHIFSELYSAPRNGKIGYFKVKILELFLILNEISVAGDETEEVQTSRSKVALAKRAEEYLAEHMSQHIKISELAKRFNVSDSYLKIAFKDVFGVPIYSYIRNQRMQIAAKWLISSDRTIMQIANECGYGNASKFSAAFRDVMGETPSDYRKLHTKRLD